MISVDGVKVVAFGKRRRNDRAHPGHPDLTLEVKDMFGQGDKLVVRLVVSGTPTGPIIGIPATGLHVEWDAIDVYASRTARSPKSGSPRTSPPSPRHRNLQEALDLLTLREQEIRMPPGHQERRR